MHGPRERRLLFIAAAAMLGGAALLLAAWAGQRANGRRPVSARTASHALVLRHGEPPAADVLGSMHDPVAESRPIRPKGGRWIPPLLAMIFAGLFGTWIHTKNMQSGRDRLAMGGDPGRAIELMRANGCAGCHTIPGVPGADGKVGPKLDATLSSRVYIAGVLPNNRENMILWLRAARQFAPRGVMPSTGISEEDARDIAAYLYGLR